MESAVRLLRLEWSESYEKICHALDRLRKREARVASDEPTGQGVTPPDGARRKPYLSEAELFAMARKRGQIAT